MSNNRLASAATAFLLCIPAANSFQSQAAVMTKNSLSSLVSRQPLSALRSSEQEEDRESMDMGITVGRRSFFGGLSFVSLLALKPKTSLAGIDVSGLRVEGQGQTNSAIASQLKAYDGSGASRVQEIKQQTSATSSTVKPLSPPIATSDPKAATYAMRYTEPRMYKVGIAGLISRYEGPIVAPQGSRPVYVSFEFPSDWLQLDKYKGGVEYVDQRNGDKLYLLRATLPEDTTLETVPKKWFGDVIFNPNGSLVKGGNDVDEYKVSRSEVTTVLGGAPRRRVLLKFATITGNGLRVERRGLADAFQVDNDVYMLVTSSNAVKFEAKGKERDTVEAIVNSFRLERQ